MPQVRVLDSFGNMLGVMATRDAQRMAEDRGLDLVEVNPNAVPPVCKIIDYGKFKYEESIKAKQQRKAQKVQKVKEVKFHPGTDTNDFNYKLSQIRGGTMMKVPYMVIVGGKDEAAGVISVRARAEGDKGQMKLEDFISKLDAEREG